MDNTTEQTGQVPGVLENLLENMPGLAYRCKFDTDFTMLYLSKGCYELTGWEPEFLLNNKSISYNSLIIKEDRAMVWQSVKEAIRLKTQFELTYRIKTMNKQIKWVWERGNGLYNEISGEVECLEGFITDITREKEASILLEEREQRLSEIMKNVDVGILHTDRKGRVLEINQSFTRITGFQAEDIVGKLAIKLVNKFLKPKDIQTIIPIIIKGLSGEIYPPFELTFNKRILQITVTQTSIHSITAFFRDITKQKDYEDNIVAAKIKAEESDRLKSSFLANMSHEIRTPMNGIVGFSELLRDKDLSDDEKDRYIDIIHANSEQLLHVINDILDISRIEAGRLGIFPHRFDPYPMMKNLEDTSKILVKHKPVNIILKYDLPLNGKIESDKNRVQQIMFNLISNSCKFTDKGSIEIGCFRNSWDFIEFYVKDTGIGVPKQVGNRIFERFRQAREGDSRPYSGTGLGLAISQALVDLLGGQIGFVSTPGKGSRFHFTVPDQLKLVE